MYLTIKLGEQTYKHKIFGNLGVLKIGKFIRFRESDVENWIADGCPAKK